MNPEVTLPESDCLEPPLLYTLDPVVSSDRVNRAFSNAITGNHNAYDTGVPVVSEFIEVVQEEPWFPETCASRLEELRHSYDAVYGVVFIPNRDCGDLGPYRDIPSLEIDLRDVDGNLLAVMINPSLGKPLDLNVEPGYRGGCETVFRAAYVERRDRYQVDMGRRGQYEIKVDEAVAWVPWPVRDEGITGQVAVEAKLFDIVIGG